MTQLPPQHSTSPSLLNPQQKAAVEFAGGHVLILAGAGTGKTKTIVERCAWLIKKGIAPTRILMMTFTRRAAREMIERLEKMVGSPAKLVNAGTFHHFCLHAMRRMPNMFPIGSSNVIDIDDQAQLMKLAREPFKNAKADFPNASALLKLYSYARNTNQSPQDYLKKFSQYDDKTIVKICQVFRTYAESKATNGYLDYDDILHIFARTLHQSEEARARLRRLYDHILVDETQDTNPLQWLILDALREPAKLYCVGDDAQSIYAFRGADFKNIHSFTKRVPNSSVLKLEENYRSTQEILDVANWLLEQSPLNFDKHLTAFRGSGKIPILKTFAGDFDEAHWIVKDLFKRHKTTPWHDHMIITRSAFAARTLEGIMVEKNVPYKFIGGTSLLQSAHVRDLFALIRCAGSHLDQLAWARYLTLWPKIGLTTAYRVINNMKEHKEFDDALKEVMRHPRSRPQIVEGVQLVVGYWDTPSEAIKQATRFLSPILAEKYGNWEMRKKDLKLLARLAERYKNLMAFLEAYLLEAISPTEIESGDDDDDDRVTLITAHSAKGTEAPVCYVIQTQPGTYPHSRSVGDPESEEEERRVLYVALTRAQDELIITRADAGPSDARAFRYYAGRFSDEETEQRCFIDNLPEEFVQSEDSERRGRSFGSYDPDVIVPFE